MIIDTKRKKDLIKKILSFIYYLRYLITIFLCFFLIILTSPKLFKHVDKIDSLNLLLKNQHGFAIQKFGDIKYKILPQPHLEITDLIIKINDEIPNLIVDKIEIFQNIKGLYDPERIFLKKIKFEGNLLGNSISGYYLPKKNLNLLYFKLANLGIESKVFMDNKKTPHKPSGRMKLNVLDYNLLFNFDYNRILKFKDSTIKNKNFKANLNGQMEFEPFFYFKIATDVNRFSIKNINLEKIKYILINEVSDKKLNGELIINYLPEKLIGKSKENKTSINLIFDNGDITSNNSFFKFLNLNVQLKFNLKKYPSYRNLNYELLIETDNINKFLKKINIKSKYKLKETKLLIKGNINLDAQKYYFDDVKINKKNLGQKDLNKLKNYFDKNLSNFLNSDFNEKRIYELLKNLIESI